METGIYNGGIDCFPKEFKNKVWEYEWMGKKFVIDLPHNRAEMYSETGELLQVTKATIDKGNHLSLTPAFKL